MRPDNPSRLQETLPLVPLRDMVVFPHMMAPFVVGRESSIHALEAALATPSKRLFLAAQKNPQLDEPSPRGHLLGRRRRHGRPVPEAAQRPHQGDGRGRPARADPRVRGAARLPRRGRRAPARACRGRRGAQGVHGQGARALRAVRQALAPPRLRGDRRLAQDRRPGALRRHARGAPRRLDAGEADAPRGRVRVRAAPEAPGPAGDRGREGQHRPPDQQQGQEADGEGAEGVLPQREDQGDPPGARPQGRPHRRGRRPEEEGRDRRDAEGRPREGGGGAAAPGGDAPGLGGGDGLAQLHRVARRRALEEGVARVEGHHPRREDPERGPLRPGEGQGAHPRVPRGAPARPEDEGLDHLLRRPSRRREDLAREVDRALPEPQVRAALARRRAGTRRRSAATGAPTSARSPARSSR